MANTLGAFYAAESAGIPKVTQAVYDRNLLTRALPLLLHEKFGQQRSLKRRSGKSMVFRRYESLAAVSSALTEGDKGTAADMSKSEVVATIAQYGNWVQVTDLMDVAGLDDVIMEATDLLGENMGESLDLIYRNVITAGTSVRYVSGDGGGTGAVGTTEGTGSHTVDGVLNKYALDEGINTLERNNAKKFTSQIGGAPKDNTYPVAASYWGLIHPDMVRDLYDSKYSGLALGTEFTPVEQYANQTQVMEGEVGKYRCVRFVATTASRIWTNSAYGNTRGSTGYRGASTYNDVYSCLLLGRDAYGIVPLDGLNSRSIVHRAGSGGPSDPMNQLNTVAWKAATTAVILNDAFMHRIMCASRA